ncbi:DUF3800 domain-containing protein [Luteimonas huabeiensis]|uniref:DUF3800 domain-containing protein n=1 Tax=Luteimonas huabeiensis TaxID=1244513 RepID=UPI00046427D1|nr:DUF3800 domain-containing protein [Luteimonas huabeiensis]
MAGFSDYIVFVDESGDHGMATIDPGYPLFVLACCLISKRDYMETVVPAIQRIKFDTFGHDTVVLHERDIRRDLGPFAVLREPGKKTAFLEVLNDALRQAKITIFAAVIDKHRLLDQRGDRHNPYEMSLRFCLERIYYTLSKSGQTQDARGALWTHVICESRGRNEDEDLELAFRRICEGDNYPNRQLPFVPVIADKKSNSIGLQLADLVARPIGMKQLRPQQENRAWEIVASKLDRDKSGKFQGFGLKCFP